MLGFIIIEQRNHSRPKRCRSARAANRKRNPSHHGGEVGAECADVRYAASVGIEAGFGIVLLRHLPVDVRIDGGHLIVRPPEETREASAAGGVPEAANDANGGLGGCGFPLEVGSAAD